MVEKTEEEVIRIYENSNLPACILLSEAPSNVMPLESNFIGDSQNFYGCYDYTQKFVIVQVTIKSSDAHVLEYC